MADDKYAKARKQSVRSNSYVLLLGLLALIAGAFWWNKKAATRSARVPPGIPILRVPPVKPELTASLIKEVEKLDAEVRRIKATGVMPMETDPESLNATKQLQDATRRLLAARYGPEGPYRVKLLLEFQETIPDFEENGAEGSILLEMAPSRLQPHSVFSFLEIARQWKGGAFHRNAPHVLQVMVKGKFKHLAFQEFSEEYPHKERTVGYAGRPSGPAWYVSTLDNSKTHGRGSQQKENPYEADSCFGKVIEGYDDVVQRIKKMPGSGFLDDPKKHVLIKEMIIMVPGSGLNAVDGYLEWKEAPVADY